MTRKGHKGARFFSTTRSLPEFLHQVIRICHFQLSRLAAVIIPSGYVGYTILMS